MPSLFTTIAHVEYGFGMFNPRGSCSAITVAMACIANEMSANLCLSEPGRKLTLDGPQATGAVTGEGRYGADAVVINADFATAMTTLVPDSARWRWSDRKIAFCQQTSWRGRKYELGGNPVRPGT